MAQLAALCRSFGRDAYLVTGRRTVELQVWRDSMDWQLMPHANHAFDLLDRRLARAVESERRPPLADEEGARRVP